MNLKRIKKLKTAVPKRLGGAPTKPQKHQRGNLDPNAKCTGPFVVFREWSSEADEKAFAKL
jgi:hypothetical protein